MIRLPLPASQHATGAALPDRPAGAGTARNESDGGDAEPGDSIASRYDSDWPVSSTQRGDLMDYAVRMVTPIRREFGRSLDVTHFLYDMAYAREIIALAKTSRDARLRGYAAFMDIKLFDQPMPGRIIVTGANPPG